MDRPWTGQEVGGEEEESPVTCLRTRTCNRMTRRSLEAENTRGVRGAHRRKHAASVPELSISLWERGGSFAKERNTRLGRNARDTDGGERTDRANSDCIDECK